MTDIINHRPILTNEALYGLGHLLCFGVLAWLSLGESGAHFTATIIFFALVNIFRLRLAVRRGTSRAVTPSPSQVIGHAVNGLACVLLAAYALFAFEEPIVMQAALIATTSLAVIANVALFIRRRRSAS